MRQILDGIRVIDWGAFLAGPSACVMLADNGADVIHLEDVQHGDSLRGISTVVKTNMILPNGKQAMFEDVNRNKRGLAVDLLQPEGKQVIYDLVDKSDVFITNFRLKARRQIGLDYESLRKRNPRLVYGSASAMGETGASADAPGLEMVGYAASGAMMAAGDEGAPPVYFASGMGDCVSGIFLAYGVMAALYDREHTGIGQEVKTSLLGAMIAAQRSVTAAYLLTGKEVGRPNRKKAGNPLYNWYLCKDGRWLAIGDNVRPVWPLLCKAIGLDWLEHDRRFDELEKRYANCEALIAILDEEFLKRDCAEWEQRFREAGDIIIERIGSIADVPSNAHATRNNYVLDWDRPDIGRAKAVGFPVSWSDKPAQLRNIAPSIGEHTEEILSEVLGYSWDRITMLKDKGVIL